MGLSGFLFLGLGLEMGLFGKFVLPGEGDAPDCEELFLGDGFSGM
jgi:hypothetical protein